MTMPRLLPGDIAPELRLARGLNVDHLPVLNDRAMIVVLWNAGCSGCLPIVNELAEFGANHDVLCIGVAVMVIDVDATIHAAQAARTKALLVLEEQRPEDSGLMRGWVTRNWLEPSGQSALPAGFIIDRDGTIAWIGNPYEAKTVLPDILKGEWNLKRARAEWSKALEDSRVDHLAVKRDLLDSLVAGEMTRAVRLIREAETRHPALAVDGEFQILKLDVLLGSDVGTDTINKFYRCVSENFRFQADVMLRLAAALVVRTPSNAAGLTQVVQRLTDLLHHWEATRGEACKKDPLSDIRCHLLLAEALILLASVERAARHLSFARTLADRVALGSHAANAVALEIDRIETLVSRQ